MKRQFSLLLTLIILLSLAAVAQTIGNISGTVKDPKGAIVVGAEITVRKETNNENKTAITDAQGKFSISGLAVGNYVVSASRNGFKTAEQKVIVDDKPLAALEIKLEIAETRVEVNVAATGTVKANADPNYRALRDAAPTESYTVSNLTLTRDVGTLTFKSGKITFLPPTLNRVAMAVFVGEGEFNLTPAIYLERQHLLQVIEKEKVTEEFTRVILTFTDDTYQEIKKQAQPSGESSDAKTLEAFKDFRNDIRNNSRGTAENIEADLLAYLYNPKRGAFFTAYLKTRKHNDLRYYVRWKGVVDDAEEIALINPDRDSKDGGVWYSAHFVGEYKNGTASSEEDKRTIDAQHYKIETAIKGEKLTANAELTFTALVNGERVIDFGLLPTLRVSRVMFSEKEIDYIQEDKKKDGSFYAVLPEALVKGKAYKILIEYQGDKVLQDAGGGSFAVGARTSWYPTVNGFGDRATYDLTFKIPKKYTLVGVGKLVKEWKEEDFAASQWTSEIPLAIAGFNYGSFKKKELIDEPTKYTIEGYATSELPGYLRNAGESIGGMTPTRLLEKGMIEAQNSMRIYTAWFGAAPYGRIAITQQPQPDFGQSWPTLVYLPIISFFDATQRWMLMGGINSRLNDFIQEVTPHEVAHQWWGHIVGWASYHDQWLSEGFADFSAGLYLQYTEPKLDKYLKFWEKHRELITEKNEFGKRANDAGPIWMGWRMNTFKNESAYRKIVYPKGSYILHMLRWMMYDRQTGDQKFIAMMKDFVKENNQRNASTEGFKEILEKHMLPKMDLDGNKRMDWFFRQYIYGTELPSYKLEYNLTGGDGECELKFKLTQSGVSDTFKMPVPLYLDYDGKFMRVGEISISGNSTSQEYSIKLPKRPKRVLINAYHDVLALTSESVGK